MHPTVLLPSIPSLPRTVITRNGSYPNILEAKSSGGGVLIRHKSEADAAAPLPPPLRAQPPPGPGAAAARPPSAQRLIAARRPSLPSRYPPPPQATQQHPPTHPQQSPPPGPPPESQHLWPQFPGCVPYPHWYEDRRILLQKAVAWHLQQEDFRRELRDITSMTSTLSGGGGTSNAG